MVIGERYIQRVAVFSHAYYSRSFRVYCYGRFPERALVSFVREAIVIKLHAYCYDSGIAVGVGVVEVDGVAV